MSDDFQAQLNRLVEQFVGQVTAVARAAAMETLNAALGLKPGANATRVVRELPVRPQVLASPRAKGAKRAQSEIEETRERLLSFILSNSGLRVEQINRALGTTTRDLTLPLKKLIAAGAVRTEGEKRSTQYFAGAGKSAGEATAPLPRRRKKT